MPRALPAPLDLPLAAARRLWLRAQALDTPAPFGAGTPATLAAVERLGYVQIDTIHVIERAHHHILWSRIPAYRRADLHQALEHDKSVFEYWTHALAYIPARDFRFFMPDMKRFREGPGRWYAGVTDADLRRVVARVRRDGALTIRDINDDALVDKDHPWASRKPSKRALQLAFFAGLLTISARAGMVKTYELTDRHFGWPPRPRPATERQVLEHLLDRALSAQGVVSLDSICHLAASRKRGVASMIEARVRARRLVPVAIDGAPPHWTTPADADAIPDPANGPAHLLSPFDPLAIQRKRLRQFFGYEHRFEAYVPKEKRIFGYFALPVLVGDRIVAAIDLKADRDRRALMVQQWTWTGGAPATGDKTLIDEALHRFEAFQFAPLDAAGITPAPPSPAP